MDWFIMCWYINNKYSSIVNVIPSTAKPCSHKQNPWVEKETFQDFLSPSCYICTSKEIVAPHSIFTTLILHAKHVWNPSRKLAFEHLKYFGKSLRNYILPHLQWSVEEKCYQLLISMLSEFRWEQCSEFEEKVSFSTI